MAVPQSDVRLGAATRGGLVDRILAWRNDLLASQRFQRFATMFPLTRRVSQQQSRALFDICAGFVYSQILLACVRLNLFDILAEGPADVATLALRLKLGAEATQRLLDAAVALRLVARRSGGRYGLGMLGAAMRGNPGIADMVEHHTLLYADLADPVALLRNGDRETNLAQFWSYARAGEPAKLENADTAAYTRLMSASQGFVAGDLLDAYDLRPHHTLMDVGGGDGTFLSHAAARAPQLRLVLFDLPPVAAAAQLRFAANGLAARASVESGDFSIDPLPRGADIISLIRVLHDHDDARALKILRNIHAALPPGGTLLLGEPMSGTPGAEPVGDAYFGFYLLAMRSGRPRQPPQIIALLEAAGFTGARLVKTRRPLLTGLITARVSGRPDD